MITFNGRKIKSLGVIDMGRPIFPVKKEGKQYE